MIKNKTILKQFITLIICIVIAFCTLPVKGTLSYVTSLSTTCENTFIAQETTQIETPDKTETISNQTKTSDITQIEFYIFIILITIIIIFIIIKFKHKGEDSNENQ